MNEGRLHQPEHVILVRYGEIGLKGKNRPQFEGQLVRNIQAAVPQARRVRRVYGRILIEFPVPANQTCAPSNGASGHGDWSAAFLQLKRVFGIVSFSPAVRVALDPEQVEAQALRWVAASVATRPVRTFKVDARRANKRYPQDSLEINRALGAAVLQAFPQLTVDVHQPDLRLAVEVRDEGVYLSSETIPGPGGLPVGVSGRGILLLSGGIDSPVAGWLAMKRGVLPIGVHFHSYPFTSEQAKEKVVELGQILARYSGSLVVHMVHFTEIQTEIQKNCPADLGITVMRRMMLRIAERIAAQERAEALITGESLGQVASQTMASMAVIGEVTQLPILRPLIGFDKAEIIERAETIGTYQTSILPYEDCCTLFLPEHPQTRPDRNRVQRAEAKLAIDALIERALAKTERLELSPLSG